MSVITSITEHPRKPGRYVVDVDGREFAVIGVDALAESRVRVGAIADDATVARLREAAEYTATYDRALNLLAFRARSSRELRRRLVQKGENAERVDKVIDRLRGLGLVNDADFARQLARSKVAAGASKRRLHQEMFRRGVDREIADQAVTDVFEEEGVSDADSIERVARKKWRTLAAMDPQTRRRRLAAFLSRRGYDSEDVWRIVRHLDADAPESPDATDDTDERDEPDA
jgi:regulatory protein